MATITREEYLQQLKTYINEEMAKLDLETRKDLRFWTTFNRDKEAEFKAKLDSQGTQVK